MLWVYCACRSRGRVDALVGHLLGLLEVHGLANNMRVIFKAKGRWRAVPLFRKYHKTGRLWQAVATAPNHGDKQSFNEGGMLKSCSRAGCERTCDQGVSWPRTRCLSTCSPLSLPTRMCTKGQPSNLAMLESIATVVVWGRKASSSGHTKLKRQGSPRSGTTPGSSWISRTWTSKGASALAASFHRHDRFYLRAESVGPLRIRSRFIL